MIYIVQNQYITHGTAEPRYYWRLNEHVLWAPVFDRGLVEIHMLSKGIRNLDTSCYCMYSSSYEVLNHIGQCCSFALKRTIFFEAFHGTSNFTSQLYDNSVILPYMSIMV